MTLLTNKGTEMKPDIKFVQLTLDIDGELCNVLLSELSKELLVDMLPDLFDDGTIAVYRLPGDVSIVPMSELEE